MNTSYRDSEPLRSTMNTYRDTSNFDESKFTTDLNDPNMMRNINSAKDTNTAYNILHKKFVNTLNQHAPIKIRSKRETKIKHKPWLTNGILISIKKKRLLFKKLKKLKVNNINDNNLFQQYKQYRNLINTLKRQSEIDYKQYFQANLSNSKKIWKGINGILHRYKCISKTILLNINGKIITDQKIISNSFNQYFVNVADNLANKMPNKNTKFQDYLKNPNKTELFLKETTPHDINELNINKSNDIYGISSIN